MHIIPHDTPAIVKYIFTIVGVNSGMESFPLFLTIAISSTNIITSIIGIHIFSKISEMENPREFAQLT